MNNNIKEKTTNGFFWSALDRIFSQVSQIIFNIILARLLLPEDFGIIGILSIFILISQNFVDSGLASGLIQKKNRTNIDYSTVFIFNAIISFFIYSCLFFSAPLIANFFERKELIILTRILSLNIIINSLSIVQRAILTINLDFKTIAKINSTAVFISGIIAIILAYKNFGVWSLVYQNLLTAIISASLYWIISKWRVTLNFSIDSFKNLFLYGSKLLIASITSSSFNEIYNATIAKFYSTQVLGFYTNAKKFSEASSSAITSILQQVTFPLLSSLQEDKNRLVEVYIRLVKMTSYLVIPFMTLFTLLADPFVRLLLTDKWESAIELLQWLCIARIFTPISVVNMNILNAVGRSDLFLKVDLCKIPMIIITLIITIPMGIKAMVIGSVINTFISFFINAYLPGKIFGYGAFRQIKDMIPVMKATMIMIISVLIVNSFFITNIYKLFFGSLIALISFISCSYFLKIREFLDLVNAIYTLIDFPNKKK